MTIEQTRTWDLFAHRREDGPAGVWYQDFGPQEIVRLYGDPKSMVQVRLTEDPHGDYAGWISFESASQGQIDMVQRREIFSIQFAYGVAAEEEAGHGKAVRLRAEELS